MNSNKGQILVLFLVFVPILLAIATFVIDMGNSYNKSNRLNNVNKMVIKYGLKNINNENIREEMIDLLHKNDDQIDEYELNVNDGQITLAITKNVKSIFGGIIGSKFYKIESHYLGYISGNKITIEKGK